MANKVRGYYWAMRNEGHSASEAWKMTQEKFNLKKKKKR